MYKQIKKYMEQFPPVKYAPDNGPLCYGGDLRSQRLLAAYYLGIFPWFNEDDPIYWWSPNPRCVLFPNNFHLSSRTTRKLKSHPFEISINLSFNEVIEACSLPRGWGEGTWITPEIKYAYGKLHEMGYALSFEAWRDRRLAGGLYGIWLGNVFFGESMFHFEQEASKAAFRGLVNYLSKNGCAMIDCQQESPHISRMGASCISRPTFLELLRVHIPDFESAFRSHKEKLSWMVDDDKWVESSEYLHAEKVKG